MAIKEVGRVITLFPHRGYGWIKRADGTEIFFHKRALPSGGKFPEIGDWVGFTPGSFGGKSCALAIEVVVCEDPS